MSSIQWIVLILCIVGVVYVVWPVREGFAIQPIQGEFPEALQASYIPRDSAGATTANPDVAKPDYRDWWDARDSFLYFLEIYSPASAAASGADVGPMLREAPQSIRTIDAYIQDPEAIPSRALLDRGKEARALADRMRRVGPADPWSVGWERPGCISHRNDDLMAI